MLKNERKFGATDGAMIYLSGIFVLLALQIIFGLVAGQIEKGTQTYNIVSLAASIVFQLGYAAIFFGLLARKKTIPTIFVKKIKPIWYGLAAISPFICLFFFYPAAYSFERLLDFVGFPASSAFPMTGTIEKIMVIVATVALAPICEELIFRSGLLSGLKIRMGRHFRHDLSRDLVVAALCAVCFSLMHMSPRQTVFTLFLGFAASLLALATGSIIPPIILHFVSNLTIVLGDFFPIINSPLVFLEKTLLNNVAGMIIASIGFAAVGIAIFIGFWYLIKKNSPKDGEIAEKTQKNSFFMLVSAGLLICGIMWVSQLIYGLTTGG